MSGQPVEPAHRGVGRHKPEKCQACCCCWSVTCHLFPVYGFRLSFFLAFRFSFFVPFLIYFLGEAIELSKVNFQMFLFRFRSFGVLLVDSTARSHFLNSLRPRIHVVIKCFSHNAAGVSQRRVPKKWEFGTSRKIAHSISMMAFFLRNRISI